MRSLSFAILFLLIVSQSFVWANDRTERRSLNSLSSSDRVTLRNQILDWAIQHDNGAGIVSHHLSCNCHSPDPCSNNLDPTFFDWHRDHILELEAYLIAHGYPKFVPLPSWNPSNCIPPEFMGPQSVLSGYAPPVNACIAIPDLNAFDIFSSSSAIGNYCQDFHWGTNNFDSFQSMVECMHGTVHAQIGGVMGTLSSPAAAIFFPWHAWIDDLYEDQLCFCTSGNNSDYFGPNEEWDAFSRTVSSISGSENTYSALNELATGGSLSIPTSRSITFRSGRLIEINPGFETNVSSGNAFIAYIDHCPNRSGSQKTIGELNSEETPENDGGIETIPASLFIYPNPFSSTSTIQFKVNLGTDAKIEVLEANGRVLTKLFEGKLSAGQEYNIELDGNNYPAGVYICKMVTSQEVILRKIILIK